MSGGYTGPTEVAGEVDADNVGARGKRLPDLAKHGAESGKLLAQRRAPVRVARKLDAGYCAQNLRHALADLERARRKARVDFRAVVHAHALGFGAEHPADGDGGGSGQRRRHRPGIGQQAEPARRVASLRGRSLLGQRTAIRRLRRPRRRREGGRSARGQPHRARALTTSGDAGRPHIAPGHGGAGGAGPRRKPVASSGRRRPWA